MRVAAAAIAACALASCASMDMPLDHAKLADGYMNSGSCDLGHIFVWDTTNNSLTRVYQIRPGMADDVTIVEGPKYRSKLTSVDKTTEVDIFLSPLTSVGEAVKAEAKAKFVRTTSVVITNYSVREFLDPKYALNCPALRNWRVDSASAFAGPRYRFLFISRVLDGSSISVSRTGKGEQGAKADIVRVGNFTFKVSYDNKTEANIQAANAPLVLEPTPFIFTVDERKDSYRFSHDTKTQVRWQHLMRRS